MTMTMSKADVRRIMTVEAARIVREAASNAAMGTVPPSRELIQHLLLQTCQSALFQFFLLLDGVSDPVTDSAPWYGATLLPRHADSADEPMMMHDAFSDAMNV